MGSETLWVAVIPAAITAVAAIIGELIISNRSAKDRDVKQAVYHEQVCNRFSSLEHENKEIKADLKEHNGYAQKFVEMHDDIRDIQKDVSLIIQDNKHTKEDVKEIKASIKKYHG